MPSMANVETVDLPMQTRAAELMPASIDESARTVEVVWSTGARVRRASLLGVYDEELSLAPDHVRLDRLNSGAPVLRVHDVTSLDSVLGSVVPGSARVDGARGVARIRFSERGDVEPVWRDIMAGHIRAVSIGYQVHRYDVERGDEREIWRAVDWTPMEISLVPIGADAGAGVRSTSEVHSCVVLRRGNGGETVTENTDVVAEPAVDMTAAAIVQERERVATIYDLVGRMKIDRSIADDLVRSGSSIDEARKVILDRIAAAADNVPTMPVVSTPLGGLDEHVTRREAMTGALLHRHDPRTWQLGEAARQYRGMTLLELARECLAHAGVNTRGLSRDEIASRAMHSTSDFPAILASVAEKTLRRAYDSTPRTFTSFCRQVSAPDFKELSRVQLGEAPRLEKVPEGAEFTHGTIGEGAERYRVETFGRIFAITRQAIINDDLDAFSRVPAKLGAAAARLESDIVWGIITGNPKMSDDVQLFHATHKNLAATGTQITVDSVGDALAAMAQQTDLDGKSIINIMPSFLIVPVSQSVRAEQLVASGIVPEAPGNVVPQRIRALSVISEPRLDLASTTAWYLATSPDQVDTIEYAYLEGRQGAYIETRNGFDVDGVEIKVRLDFGAKAIDWRGFYRNPGA